MILMGTLQAAVTREGKEGGRRGLATILQRQLADSLSPLLLLFFSVVEVSASCPSLHTYYLVPPVRYFLSLFSLFPQFLFFLL